MNKLCKKLVKLVPDKVLDEEFLRRFDEDLFIENLSKEEVVEVMRSIANVDNILPYLLDTLKNDRVRFFNSSKEVQDIVKGAFLRTQWLYKKLKDVNEKRSKESKSKGQHTSPRHA